MEGMILLREYLRLLDKEMDGFPDDSEMSLLVRNICNSLGHRLRATMYCWEVWKKQVPEGLCVYGLERERMYEAIVEWFLDGSDLLSLMSSLALPDTHIVTVETENGVMIQFCAHGTCYQKMTFKEDDEGGLVISYKDLVTGRTTEWVLDTDELLRYAPSFT